eukprot:COSAG01_NODE_14470_length_1450_cov_1.275352_1_plen_107_part_10
MSGRLQSVFQFLAAHTRTRTHTASPLLMLIEKMLLKVDASGGISIPSKELRTGTRSAHSTKAPTGTIGSVCMSHQCLFRGHGGHCFGTTLLLLLLLLPPLLLLRRRT